MSTGRSAADFLRFMDYLSEKGLMKSTTVSARKAAANKIFYILDDSEAEDVLDLDLDDIMRRFSNLQGQQYTPGSLQTYQSRLKSALEDFSSYLENPINFRPSVQNRDRKSAKKVAELSADGGSTASNEKPKAGFVQSSGLPTNVIPIPLRSDLTVYVHGLPFDLTESEAAKLANVIKAMALPSV